MTERKDVVKFDGNPVTLVGDEVEVGDSIKNFKATKQDLSTFDFYEEANDKIVIISVVPSLDTKVCEMQTIMFNEKAEDLSDDVMTITISVDLPFAQKRFSEENNIDINIVSDHRNLEFGERHGFIIKELRLLSRGVVVIGKDKKIKYVEYVNEITNQPNYEKALKAAKELL